MHFPWDVSGWVCLAGLPGGLSWFVLGLFWAYLSHLAGIYRLPEAILANLADLFVKSAMFLKNTKYDLWTWFWGPKFAQKSTIPVQFFGTTFDYFGLSFGTRPTLDPKIGPESLKASGPK